MSELYKEIIIAFKEIGEKQHNVEVIDLANKLLNEIKQKELDKNKDKH